MMKPVILCPGRTPSPAARPAWAKRFSPYTREGQARSVPPNAPGPSIPAREYSVQSKKVKRPVVPPPPGCQCSLSTAPQMWSGPNPPAPSPAGSPVLPALPTGTVSMVTPAWAAHGRTGRWSRSTARCGTNVCGGELRPPDTVNRRRSLGGDHLPETSGQFPVEMRAVLLYG